MKMRSNLILLGVFVGWLQICNAQVNQNCRANGEYCQNHWECCSNSCYSYLYKCVRNSQQRPQIQKVEESPQAAAALSPVSTSVFNIPPPPGVNFNNSVLSIEDLINNLFAPTPRPQFDIYQFLLNNRFSADSTTTEGSTIASNECLEIGKKCLRNSECCTTRCHGFLHQCVT